MIRGQDWELLDKEALSRIDGAAVRLLQRSGCRIENERLLDLLEGAGCRVERSSQRAFIPESLVRRVLERAGGQTLNLDQRLPDANWNLPGWLRHTGSYPHLLDWPSGRRRLATRRDIVNMARMAHVLDEFGVVGRVLTCSEVAPRIEPLWTTLQLARTTDKPLADGELFMAEHVAPLVRMGEILTGRPGDVSLVVPADFFIAPLILDQKQAELFLEKRRFGVRVMPGTMPISGMSAPVTPAGTVMVAVAELLAGWVLGYVVNPALPVTGVVASGSLDMRTANASFGSMEALLQDAATVQLCGRLYGIPVIAATGYVDSRRPGLDAVFQKLLPLVSAPFGTCFQNTSPGLLSAGQDYSPVQHLLDAELDKAVARFLTAFEVNDQTLAEELTVERTLNARRKDGGRTDFLDTSHTLEHWCRTQWYSRWLEESRPWQGAAAERSAERRLLARIDAYWRDAVRRYKPPALDPAKLRELEAVVRAAEPR